MWTDALSVLLNAIFARMLRNLICILFSILLSLPAVCAQKIALEKYGLRRENGAIVFDELGESRIVEAVGRLKKRSLSVVYDTMRIEGADVHDYMSVAPYWFDNGEGVWERRDGERNPDVARWEDKKALSRMVSDVSLLALAERLYTQKDNGREAAMAAGRMSEILKAWFVDEDTRMNPNMKYAQFIPGKGREGKVRGSGIIELRGMMDVVESIELVANDGRMSEKLLSDLRMWFGEMLEWMVSSPQGQKERAAKNNHGTWYAAQVLMYSHFCGRADLLMQMQSELKSRLMDQISENGEQKYEMERTKSLSYCCFNILAYEYCKDALAKEGVDVTEWEEWRRLETAKNMVRPYAENGGVGWGAQQIKPFEQKEWRVIDR